MGDINNVSLANEAATLVSIILGLGIMAFALLSMWVYHHPIGRDMKQDYVSGVKDTMALRLARELRHRPSLENPRGWLQERWNARTKGTCMAKAMTEDDFTDIVHKAQCYLRRYPVRH